LVKVVVLSADSQLSVRLYVPFANSVQEIFLSELKVKLPMFLLDVNAHVPFLSSPSKSYFGDIPGVLGKEVRLSSPKICSDFVLLKFLVVCVQV
jgi:hypothetical protein